ncbi:hypothetical protein KAR91_02945 [Candidatus Pacearchaeota archaeon]|nr:hypothetical protein [Candidatus Pacearchaeota archaeon]
MSQLKEILINRLKNKGMELSMIPGFIRSLTNSFAYYPHVNLLEVNNRLRYMGWDDFELDYFTFQLAIECLEGFRWKRSEYKPAKWFENNFMLH